MKDAALCPGVNGESVEYEADFEKEHFMRRCRFGHDAEAMIVLQFFFLGDKVVCMFKIYFHGEMKSGMCVRSSAMQWVKKKQKGGDVFLRDIVHDEIGKKANE